MPRNGSGTYTPPSSSWYPAVEGQNAETDDWNTLAADLSTAISGSIAADGQTPITANLPMSGYKLTGLAAGSTNGDSVRYEQVNGLFNANSAGVAISSGLLYGNTLSNNGSDATNDIDFAAGICIDSTNAQFLVGAALTKQLDAAWAVGTNKGGLDTGTIANTTYHCYRIMRSDTGVVDALFSTSASSPTMPANYDYKRRIGSIMRSGAAIRLFKQVDDVFLHNDATTGGILDVNANTTGTSAVSRTLSVPVGIVCEAIINLTVNGAGGACNTSATSLDTPDIAPAANVGILTIAPSAGVGSVQGRVRTNTSAQIRTRATASGATITQQIGTIGWIDTRGRLS